MSKHLMQKFDHNNHILIVLKKYSQNTREFFRFGFPPKINSLNTIQKFMNLLLDTKFRV